MIRPPAAPADPSISDRARRTGEMIAELRRLSGRLVELADRMDGPTLPDRAADTGDNGRYE